VFDEVVSVLGLSSRVTCESDPGELPSCIDLGISTRSEQHHIDTLSPDIRVPTFAVIEIDGASRTVKTSAAVPVQTSTDNGIEERATWCTNSDSPGCRMSSQHDPTKCRGAVTNTLYVCLHPWNWFNLHKNLLVDVQLARVDALTRKKIGNLLIKITTIVLDGLIAAARVLVRSKYLRGRLPRQPFRS
jgi:hypothetical protein